MSLIMPPPLPGRNPFLDPAAPTLAAVIERLPAVTANLRLCGAMVSAIRTVCRVLGRRARIVLRGQRCSDRTRAITAPMTTTNPGGRPGVDCRDRFKAT
jgi:hypothetical protein